jgi:Na+-translocating ferredoxin:NAD+ oxidoreductase RnfE subunit
MEMMMKRVMKAIGLTLAFLAIMTGLIFGIELLKEFVGKWVVLPLFLMCITALGYHFYQDVK